MSKKIDMTKPFAYKNKMSSNDWLVEPIVCYRCTNISTGSSHIKMPHELDSVVNNPNNELYDGKAARILYDQNIKNDQWEDM